MNKYEIFNEESKNFKNVIGDSKNNINNELISNQLMKINSISSNNYSSNYFSNNNDYQYISNKNILNSKDNNNNNNFIDINYTGLTKNFNNKNDIQNNIRITRINKGK